ncbi:hypothetical protein AC26_2925 [Escherichia coli 1-176-05_S3_C2]|nr:hypothetical protein AC26_2925 [Escherichia coli 1-176-05_S3_C2]
MSDTQEITLFLSLKMIFHFARAVKVTDNASVRKFKMA